MPFSSSKLFFFVFSLCIFLSCADRPRLNTKGFSKIAPLEGDAIDSIKELAVFSFEECKAIAIVFLAADCPLSQNYTLTINNISEKYHKDGIRFYAVFDSGVSADSVIAFKKEYGITFMCTLDNGGSYKKLLHASVTPEVFFCDSIGAILYSGAIDNWMYDTGKKRPVITEHYLEDAINGFINGREIKVKSTKAYGCLIE